MISYKLLVGISRDLIYKFDAVGDKDELITFWGQKVKSQGHSENKCTFHWWKNAVRWLTTNYFGLIFTLCLIVQELMFRYHFHTPIMPYFFVIFVHFRHK